MITEKRLKEIEERYENGLYVGHCTEELIAEIRRLREVLDYIGTSFDCDTDSHKYGTTCRRCYALDAIKG